MKVNIVSKNGIPIRVYTSLMDACGDVGCDYFITASKIRKGERVVLGNMRISNIELTKIKGRGKR